MHSEIVYRVPSVPVTELGGKDKITIVTMNYISEAYGRTGPDE